MPDFLALPSLPGSSRVTLTDLVWQLVAALVMGAGVALFYGLSHGRENNRSYVLSTTLVLLSGLIAMVCIVIGDSVARAFSLVGALSIVRFRTVVEDTRDTAFVIFAVIVGMAAGSGLVVHAAIAMSILGLAAIGLSRLPVTEGTAGIDHLLTLRVTLGGAPQAQIDELLLQHFTSVQVVCTSTARQGAAMEFTYEATLKSAHSTHEVVRALNQVEGVISVELKRA